jgi:hypothetical protein
VSAALESSVRSRVPKKGLSFVLRRSSPSLAGLVGLVLLVGSLAVAIGQVPVGTVIACALGLVLLEYLVAPWTIEWLVPAQRIEHDGSRYLTDHHLGEVVAPTLPRRRRATGAPGNRR